MYEQHMYTYGARRILVHVAAFPPASSSNFTANPPPFDSSSLDMSTGFNPSMAIILVVLLSVFFFMGFFSVYVRRCTTEEDNRAGMDPIIMEATTEQNGLDPVLVANLPMVAYSASTKKKSCNECVVCLTDFEEDEHLKILPKCNHVFHPQCIDMWLFSHTTCPLCRRHLVGGGSSRSFRWGSGLSFRRASSRHPSFNESSSRGGGASRHSMPAERPPTPAPAAEVQVMVPDGAAPLCSPVVPRPFRRSLSTGHNSLLRPGWTSVTAVASVQSSTAEPSSETAGSMHRSRSISALHSVDVEESGGSAHNRRPRLTRGWSVSRLRRVLSLRALPLQHDNGTMAAFLTSVGEAATSSAGRRTYERLGVRQS